MTQVLLVAIKERVGLQSSLLRYQFHRLFPEPIAQVGEGQQLTGFRVVVPAAAPVAAVCTASVLNFIGY